MGGHQRSESRLLSVTRMLTRTLIILARLSQSPQTRAEFIYIKASRHSLRREGQIHTRRQKPPGFLLRPHVAPCPSSLPENGPRGH